MKASLNGSLNSSTKTSPHFAVFGDDLRLTYEILTRLPKPVYNFDDYTVRHIQACHKIHAKIRENLQATRKEIQAKQHKRSKELR